MSGTRFDPYHLTLQESPEAGASPGWYAMDDNGRMELGPFPTEQDAQQACEEANARNETEAICEAHGEPRETFVIYADVPGVEGGPIVLPGFEAPDTDAAQVVLRKSLSEYRKELEAMNFSAEQVAKATFRLKDVG